MCSGSDSCPWSFLFPLPRIVCWELLIICLSTLQELQGITCSCVVLSTDWKEMHSLLWYLEHLQGEAEQPVVPWVCPCRSPSCCIWYPSPDSIPGGIWFSWVHLYTFRQCFYIPLRLFLPASNFCTIPLYVWVLLRAPCYPCRPPDLPDFLLVRMGCAWVSVNCKPLDLGTWCLEPDVSNFYFLSPSVHTFDLFILHHS